LQGFTWHFLRNLNKKGDDNNMWKLFEPPLLAVWSVDIAPVIAIFILLLLSCLFLRHLHQLRLFVQIISAFVFICVVYICLGAFGLVRKLIQGVIEIPFDPIYAFNEIAVSVVIIAFTLFLGRVYCGWICPIGFFQEIAGKVFNARQILNSHKWLAYLLLCLIVGIGLIVAYSLKMIQFWWLKDLSIIWIILLPVILLFMVKNPANDKWLKHIRYFSLGMVVIISFLGVRTTSPGHFLFAGTLSPVSIYSTVLILLVSLFVLMRGWCRYLCPIGALLGICAKCSSLKVIQNKKCTLCGVCDKICMMSAIDKGKIDKTSCIYCMECIKACKAEALEVKITK